MRKSIRPGTIESKIYLIRGQKVMLDKDLASLYGVPTKRLKEQVKRNLRRFPADFMFQLTWKEWDSLRSHFATLDTAGKDGGSKRGKHAKYLPYAFSENGVAMLSSVLNSEGAIEVNIQIMRTFTRIREILLSHKDLALKLNALERKTSDHDKKFEIVFQIIRKLVAEPPPEEPKPQIGFHT